ncbi:MAG: SusC/RagA family TonB-linked outer membrane protein, partial [Tannerella sp.]|nr:SusC/RagA family TonB-linked outer membrane protein [Tannerella sp.]
MKCTIFFMLLGLFSVAAEGYAQKATVSIDIREGSIYDVMSEIEEQSDFLFFYKNSDIDNDVKVTVQAKNKTVLEILTEATKGTDLAYSVNNKHILIAKRANLISLQDGKRITGIVLDTSGESVIGASIVVKGTTTGIITDVDGKFSLNVPDNAVLQISYVGYAMQEIAIGNQTNLNITLIEDALALEEVVVVGYGTMKKSDLTGSITSVKIKEDARQLVNTSIVQTLQGSVAGLNIGSVNSAGGEPSMMIRGYNTLSTGAADNAPLIVVDGTIYRGNLIDLNTNDIESIDILKDASSAAIYGSQASNGVMLITTRKGTPAGKPVFEYSTQYSVQTPSNEILPMGRAELDKFIRDANWERGSRIGPDFLQPNPDYSFAPYLKSADLSRGYLEGYDHDWYGAFTGNGHIKNHNLSVSGKNENLGYFISGGYTDEKGYLKNDNYKRFNFRVNINADINSWLSVGTESFLTTSDYSGYSGFDYLEMVRIQPWSPVYDAKGEFV